MGDTVDIQSDDDDNLLSLHGCSLFWHQLFAIQS